MAKEIGKWFGASNIQQNRAENDDVNGAVTGADNAEVGDGKQ